MSFKSIVKQMLGVIGGLAVLVGFIVLYNGWHYLSVGQPRIPTVHGMVGRIL